MTRVKFKEVFFDVVDSTNLESLRRIKNGQMHEPTVIWAERQESGRGRTGRVWHSPEGNLYCSFCVPVKQSHAPNVIPFSVSLAIHDVLNIYMDAADYARIGLKWPNDVLIDGAKCAGILIEKETDNNGDEWYVIGIGLNLVFAPQNVQGASVVLADEKQISANNDAAVPPIQGGSYNSATCLSYYTTFRPSRREVLKDLSGTVADWCADTSKTSKDVFIQWRRHAYGIGHMIIVRLADGKTEPGVFEDIDDNGFLLLRKTGGDLKKVASADVFFAPVPGSGKDIK